MGNINCFNCGESVSEEGNICILCQAPKEPSLWKREYQAKRSVFFWGAFFVGLLLFFASDRNGVIGGMWIFGSISVYSYCTKRYNQLLQIQYPELTVRID